MCGSDGRCRGSIVMVTGGAGYQGVKGLARAEARQARAVTRDNEMEFVCRSNRLGLVGYQSTTTES